MFAFGKATSGNAPANNASESTDKEAGVI